MAAKNFFGDRAPSLSQGLDDPPPHLKVGAATAYSKFHCAVQINKARIIITIRQGSASASKNYYNGCFWKSAIASVVHAKKQKILQKSGLHEALTKMLLK